VERIPERSGEDTLVRSGMFTIRITADRMAAFVTVEPERWRRVKNVKAALRRALKKAGVTRGFARAGSWNRERGLKLEIGREFLVALGREARPGTGRVELFFDPDAVKGKPKVRGDGTVDFHELDIIENVVMFQPLARWVEESPGREGVTVTGETVAPVGDELRRMRGENTDLSPDDPFTLISLVNGYLDFRDGVVNVRRRYVVDGDVDYSTGNITFVGDLEVTGNVKPGFSVKVAGDLVVRGTVEGAVIEAGGDIEIEHGLVGDDSSLARAEGDITVHHIEGGAVVTGSNLFVGDSCRYCRVVAKRKVVVGGENGLILGGEIRASDDIMAATIGSKFATETVLEVGVDPNIYEELRCLEVRLEKLKTEKFQVGRNIKFLMDLSKGDSSTVVDKDKLLRQLPELKSRLPQIQANIDRLQADISDLEARLNEEMSRDRDRRGVVTATAMVYPGVLIRIRRAELKVDRPMENVVFYEDKGEIHSRPFIQEMELSGIMSEGFGGEK